MARAEARYTLSAVDKTKSAFASVSSRLKGVGKQVAKFGSIIGAGAFGLGLVSQIKDVELLARRSKRLDVPIKQLSQLGFVAQRSGVSTSEFLQGLQRLRRRAEEAARGGGEARQEFARLNINARQFAQADALQQIMMLSTSLSNMDTGQLATSFKFLDTEGVGFLQFLRDGPEAIRALIKEGDFLGATISEALGDKAVAIVDAWTNLKTAIGGAFSVLLERFGPSLASLLNLLAVAIPIAIRQWPKVWAMAMERIQPYLDRIKDWYETYFEPIGTLAGGVLKGVGLGIRGAQAYAAGSRSIARSGAEGVERRLDQLIEWSRRTFFGIEQQGAFTLGE